MKPWMPAASAEDAPIRPLHDTFGGRPSASTAVGEIPWARRYDSAIEATVREAEATSRAATLARREADAARGRFAAGIAALDRMLAERRTALVADTVELAFVVAEAVLRHEAATRPDAWAAALRAVLDDLQPEGPVDVRVAPDDAARLGTLSAVRPVADPSLQAGDFVVEDGEARIDARIGPRLAAIRDALRAAMRGEESPC